MHPKRDHEFGTCEKVTAATERSLLPCRVGPSSGACPWRYLLVLASSGRASPGTRAASRQTTRPETAVPTSLSPETVLQLRVVGLALHHLAAGRNRCYLVIRSSGVCHVWLVVIRSWHQDASLLLPRCPAGAFGPPATGKELAQGPRGCSPRGWSLLVSAEIGHFLLL